MKSKADEGSPAASVPSSTIFADSEFVARLNESLKDGLAHLRKAERKYGVAYTMRFEMVANGALRLHVRPAGQDDA